MSNSNDSQKDNNGDYQVQRDALRAVARNVYIVNEKVPPNYDRKWKIHVLWHDGTVSDTTTADDYEALGRELRRLRRDPRATPTARGDRTDGEFGHVGGQVWPEHKASNSQQEENQDD